MTPSGLLLFACLMVLSLFGGCAGMPHCPDGEVEVSRSVESKYDFWNGRHTDQSVVCAPRPVDGGVK